MMDTETGVAHGELWNIETLDLDSEVYVFHGKASPFGSSAVAKAKKQFSDDRDVDFRHLVGKKVFRNRDALGVVVVHKPPGAHHEVLP